MSYQAHWVDPALDIPAEETAKRIELAEISRLLKLYAIATATGHMARRLGTDATSEELAIDKKRSRRIAHVAVQLASAWSGKDPQKLKLKQDVSQEAAVVDWKVWWEGHQTWLVNRQRYVATWASRQKKQDKWCKSALVKFDNELKWISYALRD